MGDIDTTDLTDRPDTSFHLDDDAVISACRTIIRTLTFDQIEAQLPRMDPRIQAVLGQLRRHPPR